MVKFNFKLFGSLFFLFLIICNPDYALTNIKKNLVQDKKKSASSIKKYNVTRIEKTMKKVFIWQTNNPVAENNIKEQWARSVFYAGVMYAYQATGDTAYLNKTLLWGENNKWKRGKRFRYADDLACGQAYLQAYSATKNPLLLSGIKGTIDSLISDPRPGRKEWWWCDALFMEPPVLAQLGKLTKDETYFRYLNQMYWDSSDYLYSKTDSLYFRDSRYFNTKTKGGKKTFWSRGNAWVISGLVQILSQMPKEQNSYKRFEEHYKEIMLKIAALQQPDGLWRASLLDSEEVPAKETSGSAFYTFAMAWGINNGLLNKSIYLPKVLKAWDALTEAVTADGQLQYVQQIGEKPENVKEGDYQEYGSGAFLMAGSEIIKLTNPDKRRKTSGK